MALTFYRPSNPSTICYIDVLPPEIATLICCFSDDEDLPNLRLVSLFWNDVATLFWFQEVRLVFKRDSIQRLLNISRHPVISKQVISLYYEPDELHEYVTQDLWEERVSDSSYSEDVVATPAPDASERDLRAWRRHITKIRERPRHNFSKSFLKKAYKEYTRMYGEQEDLRKCEYGTKEFSDAMSRLPKLSEICMNYEGAIRPKGAKHAFAAGLLNAGGNHCGIPFMRSLLLAVHEAGIELNILELGSVDWRFLSQNEDILGRMKRALNHLTSLELDISTKKGQTGNRLGVGIPDCRRYLSQNPKLIEFLAAAPNLKYLRIGFDSNEPFAPAELSQIFGSTTWPYLESISLASIDAVSENLSHFFNRLASTLNEVEMMFIRLQEGTWIKTLENMQQNLNLKSASFGGELLGHHPHQHWNLWPESEVELSDMQFQENRTCKAIEDYLVQGGTCPLLDEDAHPQCRW